MKLKGEMTKTISTVLTFFLVVFVPFARAASPVTAASPATFAEKVAVGDHALYLSCVGEGSPTVLLDAGYGDASDVWADVQAQVADFTRVCVYDRAGLGRSDPVGERSVQEVVADVARLLANSPVEGPLVLVGHSAGGLLANMYAHQHPERVVGVVLVDASHPNQLPRLRSSLPEAWFRALDRFFAGTPAFETWESDAATAQGKTVYARAGSLGALPLVVLTRDVDKISEEGIRWIKENIWPHYSVALDRRHGQTWLALQREYASLSVNSAHVVVTGSTHYIHRDKPEVVVSAVRQVVGAARTGLPLVRNAQR